MNKDMQEIKDRLGRIEEKLGYGYCNPIECRLDFNLRLCPLTPPRTATEAIHLEQLEIRLNSSIHQEISNIERKINDYLRIRM
jgi:hypothetical protein